MSSSSLQPRDASSRRKRPREDEQREGPEVDDAPAAKRRHTRSAKPPAPAPAPALASTAAPAPAPASTPAPEEEAPSPPRSPPPPTDAEEADDERGDRLQASPTDVADAVECRQPRVCKAKNSGLPEFAAETEQEFNGRPVAQNTRSKATALFGAGPGIVRSRRRRRSPDADVKRELFRLPTSADLARVTRSSSRKKPPRPVPVAHLLASCCGDSGEETEPEEIVYEPPPDVRVEAVVDATFKCSDACLCKEDESCDDRCAAYSPLPFPGFTPPLYADGDELGLGFVF